MRFLGEDPKDWDDEVFVYELRFEQEPDDATLVALANAWEAHCKQGMTGRGGWRFSKEFAYLNAFPRRGDARALFADVAKFVRSAHGIAPLVEVVHITAAEDYADLDPGPPCAGSQRPRDAAYPEPAGREAFDAVFRGIFEAERQARFAAAVAPPKAKCVGLARTPSLWRDLPAAVVNRAGSLCECQPLSFALLPPLSSDPRATAELLRLESQCQAQHHDGAGQGEHHDEGRQ